MSANTTELLKMELWKQYWTKEIPSEWDGRIYGGGKLSQRFWEYHKTIEMLDLHKDSVLLDIGGGSPEHGTGFFTGIAANYISKVIILDSNANVEKNKFKNVEIIPQNANYDLLKKILSENKITHISCISVFEHISDEVRIDMVKAINEFSKAEKIAVTLEYHATHTYFEHQLTTKTLSNLFLPLNNYYLSGYHKAPTHCINALKANQDLSIELWYPLALEFRKNIETK